MLAPVTTAEARPEHLEFGIRIFREQVGATAKKMVGLKGSYLLADREKGRMMGIARWDTEGNLQASTCWRY